ncbi:FecR domain-containing protein [Alcaligenes faecalis]|uniref:FecR domain-containing protein n=1 Tax=Alcaligenes faecalis TaxID=511 RepID=UPI0005A6E0E9|nr:FecR domain-containing protein [Alcaligenes faecalis]ATI01516.1 iron dicitrate transport regulator FecR [Alcaligenes faecalis]AYZ90871.1 DUF4880 domain-containing protein [Alcaligenes faecalis]KAA1285219.1 DUF4880 domain-containing protein [Alcaligenes faecalis]MCX5594839.1 FecR domain-containing protein [Alcaligenes faecalis]OSZ30497.1 iron dicitrate transport regulator FecR [Alcaligenes faecalis]
MSTSELHPDDMLEPSFDALEQAAEWFALLRSDEASAQDQQRWQGWLAAQAEHRKAWQYVERISGRFEPIQSSDSRQAAVQSYCMANRRMGRRRQLLLGLGTLAGSGLGSWLAWQHTSLPGTVMAWSAEHRTARGEVRQLSLPDGSSVWLSSDTALNHDYRGDQRLLSLVQGEILIDTAADPGRPFLVKTRQGLLRALGTRFTVRLDGQETFLAVYQGAVQVDTVSNGKQRIVYAGQQTQLSRAQIADTVPVLPERQSWTKGILVTDNTPLIEVVRELQRYRGGHLSVSPEAAQLPVIGSYPSTDPDRALKMLEGVLPIRIKRTLPWWVSIELAEHRP